MFAGKVVWGMLAELFKEYAGRVFQFFPTVVLQQFVVLVTGEDVRYRSPKGRLRTFKLVVVSGKWPFNPEFFSPVEFPAGFVTDRHDSDAAKSSTSYEVTDEIYQIKVQPKDNRPREQQTQKSVKLVTDNRCRFSRAHQSKQHWKKRKKILHSNRKLIRRSNQKHRLYTFLYIFFIFSNTNQKNIYLVKCF